MAHEEEESTNLYTDQMLPELSGHGERGLCVDVMLSGEDVESKNNLHNDDEEPPKSPTAGCGDGEEACEADGVWQWQ